jgi:uncharacterized protein YjbI with pentapeptide repeats
VLRWLLWPVIALLALGMVLLLLWAVVAIPARLIDTTGIADPAKRLDEINALRTSLLGVLGGLAVVAGAVVGALNLSHNRRVLEETQRQNRASQEQNRAVLELQRRGQTTERFTKAIEQLGCENLDVRIGAVYALEQIAQDSVELHWPIMEVLTAYLREHTRTGPDVEQIEEPAETEQRLPADQQAIATVIGRRRHERDPAGQRLDLHATRLPGVEWGQAHLEGANLYDAHLEGASLNGVHLEGASLAESHLKGAYLYGAHLEGAYLHETHLECAELSQARLERANLHGAHLARANLPGAVLTDADLRGVDLQGARLERAHLEGADLTNAQLKGAALAAANLRAATVKKAHLADVNLKDADLGGAHLEGAVLVSAELQCADLTGAYPDDAFLYGARGLTKEQRRGSVGWDQAHFDAGLEALLSAATPASTSASSDLRAEGSVGPDPE